MTASSTSETKNVRFYTLGCKVNQYETQAMREALERRGVCDVEGQKDAVCDWVVLNTCTVTEEADRNNRYWIRRLRREHPGARLIVTGCYVQKNRKDIESMPEVDLVLLNHEKAVLADRVLAEGERKHPLSNGDTAEFLPLSVSRSEGRTRAYVKIQDGCDNSCSYCKVALVRGHSRSRELAEILGEVARLRDSGYREIILTGIQLGAYGRELKKKSCLREVIECCATVEGIERIRLSSIEVTDINDLILEAFRDVPKLCPHLHVPLQSGDNEVLKRMNRPYTREFYRDRVLQLKQEVPDFVLSVDVMAGFPGETEEQLENTARLLKEIAPLKSHVFPYSRREGTRAADWKTLPVREIRDRAKYLMKGAEKIARQVRAGFLGKKFDVLAEEKGADVNFWEGRAANYLKVFFKYPQAVQGCIIPIRLDELYQDGFLGTVVKSRGE